MDWQWTPGKLGFLLAHTSVRSDFHISTSENSLGWNIHETRGSVGAKLTCTWQLSCIFGFLLLKGQEELDVQKEWAWLPVKLCLLLEGFDTKDGLLEALLYGWNWYCVHSFPWTPVNTHWKEGTRCISAGAVCPGWGRASRPWCGPAKAAANAGGLRLSPCSLARWTMLLPSLAWREERLGLTSGDIRRKSCAVTTLSFAQFPLLLIVTARGANTESYLCYWAMYRCIFPEWCSVAHVYRPTSGCDSLLEKVSSFFQRCHQQSIVFKLQSRGTLADSAF